MVAGRDDGDNGGLRQSGRQSAWNSGHGESYHGAHIGNAGTAGGGKTDTMCRAMPTTSTRALGVMLSGAALAGWLAGSTLSPPVAVTQVVSPRPVAPPNVRTELPRVNWPVAVARVGAPAPSRNPFTFRGSERNLDGRPPARLPVAGEDVAVVADDARTAAVPEPPPPPRWRLSGIATNEGGDVVAVISGSGDVFLMRAGEELPGGDAVTDVGADHVVVRTAAGPLTLRLP